MQSAVQDVVGKDTAAGLHMTGGLGETRTKLSHPPDYIPSLYCWKYFSTMLPEVTPPPQLFDSGRSFPQGGNFSKNFCAEKTQNPQLPNDLRQQQTAQFILADLNHIDRKEPRLRRCDLIVGFVLDIRKSQSVTASNDC